MTLTTQIISGNFSKRIRRAIASNSIGKNGDASRQDELLPVHSSEYLRKNWTDEPRKKLLTAEKQSREIWKSARISISAFRRSGERSLALCLLLGEDAHEYQLKRLKKVLPELVAELL